MTGTLRGWVPPTLPSAESDADLIRKVRSGDSAAFGELYQRHADAAHRLASRFVSQVSDRDDLVATVFADVLAAIRNGSGPVDSFRPYLLVSVRRAAARLAAKPTHIELDEFGVAPTDDAGDPVVAAFERDSAMRAFASLPGRWQTVLWHTVVEGESPAEVAPYLGLTPNAVSTLASRAREGLRQAYVAQHVPEPDTVAPSCAVSREQLAAYTRGALSRRGMTRVRGHVENCPTCRRRSAELADVDSMLTRRVAPAVLTVPLANYLTPVAQNGGTVAAAAQLGSMAKVGASFLVGVLAVTGLLVLRLEQPEPADALASPSAARSPVPSSTASPPTDQSQPQHDEATPSSSATAHHGSALLQASTPVIVPGGRDVIRLIVSPPAGTAVTVHVTVPLSTTPAVQPAGSACSSVTTTQVECRAVTGRSIIDIPIDVAANAGWNAALSGGNAWVTDATSGTTIGSIVPLAVRTQQQECP